MPLPIGPELTALLVAALNDEANVVPVGVIREADFERRFVEPVVVAVLKKHAPLVEMALHGWKPPGVRAADLDPETVARSKSWTSSKGWSVTRAWGKHTPDMAFRDLETGATMVIEVKFGANSGGGLRTGELQRMIGQCVMAKLHHAEVLGVFGYRGQLTSQDEVKLEDWLKAQGIRLVLREVPS